MNGDAGRIVRYRVVYLAVLMGLGLTLMAKHTGPQFQVHMTGPVLTTVPQLVEVSDAVIHATVSAEHRGLQDGDVDDVAGTVPAAAYSIDVHEVLWGAQPVPDVVVVSDFESGDTRDRAASLTVGSEVVLFVRHVDVSKAQLGERFTVVSYPVDLLNSVLRVEGAQVVSPGEEPDIQVSVEELRRQLRAAAP